MDILSNGRNKSQFASNKRKRKSTSTESSDLSKPSKRAYIEDYSSDSISSADHYSSSPIATPPSISNILSPDTTSKDDPDITSRVNNPPYETNVSCFVTPLSDLRLCPLPALAWGESKDIWKLMCRKDEMASLERNPDMLAYHPGLQSRMRAILLDWLIEVCDVYKLHRETYYLAVDYLDRFLSAKNESSKTPKTRLQLIGITCLFVAAKVEEIYPPKIGEFAYVTDGACEEEDIIYQEQILLSTLGWKTSAVTIIGWLSVYMQLYVSNRTPKTLNKNSKQNENVKDDEAFLYPQFSGFEFVRATQLLDLCTLDVEMASFSYSILAASAIAHTLNKSIALKVSGFEWNIIEPCFRWMQPFYDVISESSEILLLEKNEQVNSTSDSHNICPNMTTDDSHIIQTHNTSLDMLDKVIEFKQKYELTYEKTVRQEASPAQLPVLTCPEGLLTPPATIRKSSENTEPSTTQPKILYQ
ncbi:G1/S-specific cyclin-E [Bradysia coprophila]|uniref:G1/S-specific cyclin-E n=1 Tax=Bradysia coprophila TaxID=38358 RepID=UPI00187DBDCC|nr:G1/S-specific cyclin-E [Bradysia coprophila]XP_037040214.1 G1/S-specific cyclin-E [Bradysia coprophila]XP_037040215.1 G1/S-specific cyclin-E [Bradysia coprophila]